VVGVDLFDYFSSPRLCLDYRQILEPFINGEDVIHSFCLLFSRFRSFESIFQS